ncbi:AP-5 complex subunit zeta-1-like isoform X1 [Dermacentor albipictus]|uniref:AP-5 complex subunit zeta-1-like isoform X1 n=1 Tax=Dermacentor albipictus TaxID=60249 RepID=UPI0031FCE097
MAASFVDDLISVRSHRRLNLSELLDNLPKQLTKDVLQQLHAAVLECDPELIPQQETAVSSLLVAVLDEKLPPGRRHLALSVLESLCPQYGLEEMLLPLPLHQLTLFLQALLAQGTDSPHYRSLLDKLLGALEDAAVGAPVKREILLYVTRVAEAQADLLSREDAERVFKQLPSWLMDCSLFSSPRLLGVSSVTGPSPSSTATGSSRFRRSESAQSVSELDGVVSQETFTVLTSAKFYTGDQWLNGAVFSVLGVWLRRAVSLCYTDETLVSASRKYCLYLIDQTHRKPIHPEDFELQQLCLVEAVRTLDLVCQLDSSQVPEVIIVIQRLATSHLLSRVALGTALLEFFLHHGAAVLHKTEDSLSQFFLGPGSRVCLSVPNSLQVVHFTLRNLAALCDVGATEKYFPALLKIFAWNPQQFKSQFLSIVPAFMSAKSVVEVFHSLVDLPALTAALVLEREMMGLSEGARTKRQSSLQLGTEVHKSMLKFVLRDISGIGDTFDGVAKFHTLIADQVNHPKVVRCSEHAPDLLGCYLKTFVQFGDSELASRLLPAFMERLSVCFGSRGYCERLRKLLADVLPQLFRKFPDVTFLLTSEFVEFLSHTSSYDAGPDFFANLVWAIGEFASPNESSLCSPKAVCDFFEVLELLAFELLSTQGLLSERRTRLLCIVITSLSKLAVRSQDLVARALLCLSKTGQLCSTCQGQGPPWAILERRVLELTAIIKRSGAASDILTPPKEEELKRRHEDLAQLPALVRLVTAVMSTQE